MIDSPISKPLALETRIELDTTQRTQAEQTAPPSTAIYRFKLSKHVTDIIERFSIIHRDDETDDFKQAWEDFCEQNSGILMDEQKRLASLGCKQDFDKKIYTSARYYYKNKNNEDSPVAVATKQREYNKTSADKLLVVDCFIKQYVMNNINHRPETVYNEFVREKGDDYVSKKVFKNKLYVFTRNHYQEQQVEQEQKLGKVEKTVADV